MTLTSTFSVTGDRTNIATATGDTPDGGTVSDDDDAVVDVIAPAIQIVKTAGSAADGAVLTTTAGDVLYTYVVSNTGDADLSDVSVVDDNGTAGVPGDDVVIGTIPSLAAGASVTLTSTFSVTGDRTNIATATGDTPDGGTVSDDDDAVVDVIAPAIQIVKTAGSAADGAVLTTTAGDVLYTYVVSNTGDADLSDVSVVDDNGTAGVPGDDVTIGTIPSLAAGASVTLTSTFSVTGDRTNIATATGDTPDGGTVSDDDDAVVDVIAPAIQIVKTAGSAADGAVLTTTAGDVLYTYVVSNTGDADLSDVSVVDDNGTAGVPGDDVTIGTIPSLAAGASVTLTSTFSVTGDRTNIATATGDTPDGGTVSDDDDAVVDVIAPAIQIVKTAGSAADGAVLTTTAGDVLYTYVVSNTGDADLSDVSVVDDNGTAGVPGDDVTIGTIPSLAAGASVTLTSTFSVTGDRTNIATATGDTPDGGTVSDDDDAVVDVIAPAIQIVKTAGSAADGAVLTTTAGDVLYTYVVSNTGDADLSDVSVVDDNGTAGVPGDDVTIGTIPSLAAGASVTLTSTFSVTGDRTNIATATGDTPDGGTVSDDDDAVVDVIAPAIQIVKTAGSAADGAVLTTTAGDVLYTYVVSNTGDADLSDVSVVDDNGTAGVPGDDVTIGTIPSLAAGASVTLTSTFSVTGDRTNIATATGDTPDGGTVSDDDDAVVDVIAPAIQIVKTAGSAADGAVLTTTAGDVLYTYVVSNTGDADLSDVSVVDDNGTAGVPGDDVTIGTIPSLAAGASVTLTSTFSVTGDRTNIATATGDTPDGGTVSDDDDAVVDVIAPAIQIVKTAGSAADGAVLTTTAGDVLYTYVVSNTGDADLSDVSVVDDNGTAGVPGDDVTIGTIPSLAAGASVTLTSTFSVTGDRTNIATATGDTPDGGTVSDDDDAVVDVIAPAIQIVKTAGSAADGAVLTTTAGDVLYTYVVSNTGDADLSDVSVVDDNGTAGVPGDDVTIGTIPSLAAGASVTLTSTFSVTGDRTNIATATGDTPDGGTVSDDDDAVVDVIAPAIQIVKTAGSAADGAVLTTTAGDVLYTYVVSNTGDADLSDVSVVDDNGTAGVPGDDVTIGTIPSLAAGASVTLTSTFSVTGDRTNIATATGDTPDGGTVSDDDDAVVHIEQRGSIGDRVWQDMNYNGIQDPGEPGLGGFVVNLLDASGSPTGLSMNTDASGNYLFSDLAAGDYRIQVLAQPGYYYTKPNVGPDDLDSDVDSSGVTSIINLSPGESELDWDAGLYRKATLGDRVWLDRDKDGIQDANEAGVGHVVVTLLDAGGGVLATTTTDVFGNYLFSNLDPGTYGLEFDKALAKTGAISVAKYPWTLQNAGGNPNLDSDVEADPGNPNLAFTTAPIVLTSGENDLSWDAGITPIVIDLNGDGIHTISRADSQGTFDLLGTGAGIKSGWLSGEDGFLVIDGNANDRIDDISEMFGGSQKGDGFAKLASFDSNRDGVVDASDADFASLKVWQDANGNHQTDAGELISLADAGVLSLSLDFTELPFRDAQDNLHLERSSATLSDGAVVDMTDVYLNVSTFDAAAAGVSLPSLGELMSSDNSLDSLWSNPELDWVSQEDQPLETTSAADTFGGTPMDYSVDASGAAGLSTLEVQPQFACCDLF
ncbi:MAG: SdrD B-like domain-containing protein [Candidatus Accumulibacter meliphilus]|uniref:beta strand repeat-containing protein n=1 Tax=Candidatus Accumulibacter meliphilus TaxID=2211374 RepID=UPI002FC301CF